MQNTGQILDHPPPSKIASSMGMTQAINAGVAPSNALSLHMTRMKK